MISLWSELRDSEWVAIKIFPIHLSFSCLSSILQLLTHSPISDWSEDLKVKIKCGSRAKSSPFSHLHPYRRLAEARAVYGGRLLALASSILHRCQRGRITVAQIPTTRSSRVHYPLISLPASDQFRHVLCRFITSAMATEPEMSSTIPPPPGLKKIAPYWYPYTTMAKGRWLGREILEMVSTEFRDRSMEYYVSWSQPSQG